MTDQTPLQQLNELLSEYIDYREHDHRAAATVAIEQGWRPPARVIETIEDLNALPIGAIVVELGDSDWKTDPCPNAWLHVAIEDCDPMWQEFGSMRDWPSTGIELPVIVLHAPANGDTDAQ